MNVTNIFDNEPHIWRCDCGSCGFLIYEDGSIQCVECELFQEGEVVYVIPQRRTTRTKKIDKEYSNDE